MSKYFIEIGSCDFGTLNHLADYGWKGIIVEPIKKYLDNIPRKEGIEYVNAAIDNNDGKRIIQTWKDEWINEDPDYRGMSGFNQLKENQQGVYDIEVDTLTASSLLKKYKPPRIDFLKIDTEGHDFIILRQFLQLTLRPKLIKAEWYHFDKPDIFLELFKNKNYQVYYEKKDLYAIDLL